METKALIRSNVCLPFLGSQSGADVPQEVQRFEDEDHLFVDGCQDLNDLLQVPRRVFFHLLVLEK